MCTTHSSTIDTSVYVYALIFGIVYAAPSNENEVEHSGSSVYAYESCMRFAHAIRFPRETFSWCAFLNFF